MIGYNNPKVELLKHPVGLDFAIVSLQQALAGLDWLDVCFGRCSKQALQKGRYYPQALYKGEPYSLLVNDNLRSYCFFNPVDPLTLPTFEQFSAEMPATQNIDIYFWVNLNKVDKKKGYDFTEELRIEALKVLRDKTRFVATESFIEIDNVFKPFYISETFKNFTKYPFSAFRIRGEITYNNLKCSL